MIAAMVGAILFMMLLLIGLWFWSPAFRIWAERAKYAILKQDDMFEHARQARSNDNGDA